MVDIGTCWRLTRPWYGDRLDHDWRPKTPQRMEELFAAVGLTEPFWSVA